MRVVYFPELPLDKIKLSGIGHHPEYLSDNSMRAKFNDVNSNYGGNILESIKKYGQLDPSFGRCTISETEGIHWVVEPGQTRWMALYKLKRPTQKILVKVRDEDEPYFHMISDSEHKEIKTMEEAAPLFTDKNNLPSKGYGYLKRKRRQWFNSG